MTPEGMGGWEVGERTGEVLPAGGPDSAGLSEWPRLHILWEETWPQRSQADKSPTESISNSTGTRVTSHASQEAESSLPLPPLDVLHSMENKDGRGEE